VIFSPGQRFGAYSIISPLGRGGMGEVYRARDTRLGRDVALKVIREDSAGDPHRASRFEQEARAASSLNHPNIVVVYEIGDALLPGQTRPVRYLAMELLDGEPVSALLQGQPLPLRRALDWASQLADGLARAHESGIVHRDLKPSNILVTSDGRVKILDFGVAKLREPSAGGTEALTAAPETLTSPGVMVGTVGYMSPEQARGESATAASDQFSLGCILYEMLTGNRAFARTSTAETVSAILRDEPPPIEEANPKVPGPIRWIVERCLAKSSKDRYVSTRDLARDLQTFREHPSEGGERPLPRGSRIGRGRRLWKVAAGAALAAAAGALAILLVAPALRSKHEPDFRRLTFRRGVVWRALFVPKSEGVLYTASWEGAPTRSYLTIPESSGNDRSLESESQLPMAYSADGSQVLVLLGWSRAAINARGTLAWWPALGGKPRPILQNAGWADWSEHARLLAVVRDTGAERILDVRKADGALERSVFRTTGGISYVRFSPDGERIAFIHHPSRYDDAGEVRLADSARAVSRVLTPRFERCVGLDWNERSGDIWFTASPTNLYSSTLWKVSVRGRMRPLQSLPDFFALQDVSSSGERFLLVSSASGTGLFVRRNGGPPRDLTWLGSSGVADISPDGKVLLFSDGGASEKSLGTWTRPLDGGDAVRLGAATPGKFSPDGRSIIGLTAQVFGPQQLVLIPVGPGVARQLTFSRANHSMPSFAVDDTILFVRSDGGKSEVWRMSMTGAGARSLGAEGCDMPSANPSLFSFLCRGSETKGALYFFPMEKGPGRKLYELPDGRTINYARWSSSGNEIFLVTRDLRFLTIDASDGSVLKGESVDLGEGVGSDSLRAAAFNGDASIQAYSFERFSSGLYLAGGL
jgi:serine/threonine protein kinase/Tol biopolymer transport system component